MERAIWRRDLVSTLPLHSLFSRADGAAEATTVRRVPLTGQPSTTGALCKTKRPSVVDSREDSLLNRVKAYTETHTAKEAFRRRKCQVEPAFGELKTSRGMRQAALRGNWKVQVQALMAFAAYNIKRLVKDTARPRDAREAEGVRDHPLVALLRWFLRPGRAIAPAF
jgi:hypothetical protein